MADSNETAVSLREYIDREIASITSRYDDKIHDLRATLAGFPQEYATAARVDAIDTALDVIRADHVQRREVDEIKGIIAEGTGRRNIVMIMVTSLVSISIVLLTFFVTDRQNFQDQIHKSEKQIQIQQLQITKLQDKQQQERSK